MARLINLALALFVLIIGEIIIYNLATALDIPVLIKWLAIIAIPVGIIVGATKSFMR